MLIMAGKCLITGCYHKLWNRNGGFYQLDVENKNKYVEIYKNTTDGKHGKFTNHSLRALALLHCSNLRHLEGYSEIH